MLKNLKLQGRILAGYSVPLLLLSVASIIVYHEAKNVSEKIQDTIRVEKIVESAHDISWSIVTIERESRSYLIDQSETHFNQFNKAVIKLSEAIKNLQDIKMMPDQQKRFQEISRQSQQVIELNQGIIDLVKKGQQKEAIEFLSNSKNLLVSNELETNIERFNEIEAAIQAEKRENAEASIYFLSILLILATVVGVILSLLLGWTLAKRITKNINETATIIASSSIEIASTADEQERIINQQASSVHQITSSMAELATSSTKSANRAESCRVKVEQIARQIVYLSEQVNQIDKIANLVSDIANQTNMLALNAAVEAVHAGQHGKGFGVVASEIRKLADQSKRSADKISSIVSEIYKSTNSVVVITDSGHQSVESIVAAMNDIANNAQEICLNVDQQALAIQQVLDAMNNLNQSAQQTAQGIAQTTLSIQQLNEAAIKLKQNV